MILQPEYISDIVMDAMDKGHTEILFPIIQKYDKLYKNKSLMGPVYREYVNGVYTEYTKAIKEK